MKRICWQSVFFKASYITRLYPPAPPRLGWSWIESRSPSAAAATANSGWSTVLSVPWSATMTAPITSSTKGSEVSARRAFTQSAGRLKVGIPMAMLARPGAGTGEYQPALCTVTLLSVVMSNQIQPPSSNGASSISNSAAAGVDESTLVNSVPPTLIRAPLALDRYTSMRPLPVNSTRSTTDSRVDQRRQ